MNPSPIAAPFESFGPGIKKQTDRHKLKERTKSDYLQCSIKLLEVMGNVPAAVVRPANIARYLRVERADAPTHANREIALLSNLMNVAIERGKLMPTPASR